MNIYDENASYLYAYRHSDNGMMNIGCKTPKGEGKESYITSLREGSPFWKEFGAAKTDEAILFIGDEETVKALEWFALDYGTNVMPDKFYNLKNNAHKGKQNLLTKEMKQGVIDYIEGRSNGISISDDGDESDARSIVESLMQRIANGEFKIEEIPVSEVYAYERSQVRYEKVNQHTVSEIKTLMEQDPARARETFKPVIIVTDGEKRTIVDGNTRTDSAHKAKGWNQGTIPCIVIDEKEFGETEMRRMDAYRLFGLTANAKSFEIKVPNKDEDIMNDMNDLFVREGLDLNLPIHRNRARELSYKRYETIIPSKKKISGLLKAFFNEFEKNQAELQYSKNLITYDKAFFTKYAWEKYGKRGVSTIHTSVSKCIYSHPFSYIVRVMAKDESKKGAIIVHYTNKKEFSEDHWVEDLKKTIKYSGLDIVVDVLPAFGD